jgi:hypothetical protein
MMEAESASETLRFPIFKNYKLELQRRKKMSNIIHWFKLGNVLGKQQFWRGCSVIALDYQSGSSVNVNR